MNEAYNQSMATQGAESGTTNLGMFKKFAL